MVSKFKRNIIDHKLEQLEKEGKLPPSDEYTMSKEYGFKIRNIMRQEYWIEFVAHLSDEELDFILSVPQSGNWNSWLYDAAQQAKGIFKI